MSPKKYTDPEELKTAILAVLKIAPTRPPSKAGFSRKRISEILKIHVSRILPVVEELIEEGSVELIRILKDNPPVNYYLPTNEIEILDSPEAHKDVAEFLHKQTWRKLATERQLRRISSPEEEERTAAEQAHRFTRTPSLPVYLYHDTSEVSIEEIKDQGLLPGTDGKIWFRTESTLGSDRSRLLRVETSLVGGTTFFGLEKNNAWTYRGGPISPNFLEIYEDEQWISAGWA